MQSSIIIEEDLHHVQDLYSEGNMCQDFMKLNRISEDDDDDDDDDVRVEEYVLVDDLSDDDDDDEDEEEEEEFSFVCGEENRSPIAAEDAFADGQIKAVFPLFNRDLFFSREDLKSLHENLPTRPPVKKVFVETSDVINNDQVTAPSAGDDEISGPYCEWTSKTTRKAVEASPEVCKKSNSTGFSKIWRIKEFAGRCNSDGRDAFVFLNNNGHAPPPPAASAKAVEKAEKTEQSTAKIIRKVKKSKTASLSPHEVYLKSKAKGEERRRSYLPYRPELVGFFTNVNGGLTKNVHPF